MARVNHEHDAVGQGRRGKRAPIEADEKVSVPPAASEALGWKE